MEQEHVLRLKSPGIIRYRSYWTHRVWLGDPKLLQDIFQAEREGLVEKPEFPPFHRVCFLCFNALMNSELTQRVHEDCVRLPGRCTTRVTWAEPDDAAP